MDDIPALAVFGQRVGRMEPQLEFESGVLVGGDGTRPARDRLRCQVSGGVQAQVAVDRPAIDPEQFGDFGFRMTSLDSTDNVLTEFEAVGAHGDHSLPEPPSIPPALCFRKTL